MSEFHVEVVRIGLVTKHQNADTLSFTEVLGGYPVLFKTGDFVEGQLAVYVPIDALVPVARPEFAFLDAGKGRTHERIKARRLRGVFSMGLLVAAPDGAKEGDDVQAALGVEKYLPPAERESTNQTQGETRKAKRWETVLFERRAAWLSFASVLAGFAWMPDVCGAVYAVAVLALALVAIRWKRASLRPPNVPTYDIEGIRKFKNIFAEGEEVWISEKCHGCNSRYVHTGRKLWCGSRTLFRFGSNDWTAIAERYGLADKLKAHPGMVLFGEIYGAVQDLKYGVPPDERVRFVAFDVMNLKTRQYLDVDDFLAFCKAIDVPAVPTLYRGPWSPSLLSLAEGKTTMPGATHCREGIVIKSIKERTARGLGRVVLKLAGEGYLTRKEAE